MKRIVFKNNDGTCGIIVPSDDSIDDDGLKKLAEKDVPKGLEWRIVSVKNIPSDRTFRNAWTDDNATNTVDVDMHKARNIHMTNIRLKRNKKLQELDIETMRGKDVQSKKQVLRDLPKKTDLSKAKTPEDLMKIWPKEL